jgi:hypothetical protein
MSAYYLKQVVKEWSLATIYKGMMEFMAIQVVAIALLLIFPPIATWLPEKLFAPQAATEQAPVVDPAEAGGASSDALERYDDMSSPPPAAPTDDTNSPAGDALEAGDMKPTK